MKGPLGKLFGAVLKNRSGTKGKERDGLGEKKNRHEKFKKKTNHVGIIR